MKNNKLNNFFTTMKKVFLTMAVCGAMFASCTNTEDVYEGGQSEIKLAPVTAVTTRANFTGAIDGVTYPASENFDVFAYWANEAAGKKFTNGTNYLIATDATGVEFKNKGGFWGGITTYYWPKNGSLRFAAYSPSSVDMTHVQATDTYTSEQIAYPTNIAETYEILVAPTSESYTAQTATDKVSVVFEHALSWITFKLKSTEVADCKFTVKSIVVNDIKNVGTLTANMEAGTKTWALTDAKTPVLVFNDSKKVGTAAAIFETPTAAGNGVLVLPQATTSVTITFTQEAMDGTPQLDDQVVTVPLVLDGANTPWEPGKHYIYTVIFDLDEILINPSVIDWEDVNVPVIDATAIEVSTEEQLVSAVAAGKSVRLTGDIAVTEPLVVGAGSRSANNANDVVIELNGNTISATEWLDESDNSTNAIAFWVKQGGNLTINGPGKVETAACDYSIAVWADGGNVTINGGEFYNAGEGSDLIYVKRGGSVVINGGYFKACEKQEGVDGTQEKYSAINLSDNSGSTATVYGGSFYGFNPANNKSENPQVSFVAEGYTVTEETGADGVVTYTVVVKPVVAE